MLIDVKNTLNDSDIRLLEFARFKSFYGCHSLSFAYRVPTQLLKAPLCNSPPVIPPGVLWIPLSKGLHREPHEHLIPPANLPMEIAFQICISVSGSCKVPFRFHLGSL